MKFRATILQAGKTATGIPVPAEVVEALGSSKKPAVHVSIGAFSYRSSVASMGGQFMIPLSAERREAAGVAAGQEVEVELQLDSAPREVAVPEDLQHALAADAQAKRFFEGLSYSNKLRHVLAIEGAKAAETRQRRIEKSVELFRQGKS